MKRRVRERVVGVSAEDDGEAVDKVGRELIVVCHWPTLLLLLLDVWATATTLSHNLSHVTPLSILSISHFHHCLEQRRIGDHSFGPQTVTALIVNVGSSFTPCNIGTFRSATRSKNRRRSWLSASHFDTRGGEIGVWFGLDHEDRSHLHVDEDNDYESWLQDNLKVRAGRRCPSDLGPWEWFAFLASDDTYAT